MRYIRGSGCSWDFVPYLEYLSSNASLMDERIASFASDPAQSSLRHPNALHDARIERLEIFEDYNHASKDIALGMQVTLLGQNRDRHIILVYRNVVAYSINTPSEFSFPPYKAGHGDIIVHEMIMEPDGTYVHELLFSRGTSMLIRFKQFNCDINMA